MRHLRIKMQVLGIALLLGACAEVSQGDREPVKTEYLGIQTALLDNNMVSFRVAMRGAKDAQAVEAYGRCAAAQYALIRGAGFARHIKTQVGKTGATWVGEAVYLVDRSLPNGIRTIDAEVVVRDCGALGIPTV